jgi:hypothetical protein
MRATAATRAANRAISDLVAFCAVSAEEASAYVTSTPALASRRTRLIGRAIREPLLVKLTLERPALEIEALRG